MFELTDPIFDSLRSALAEKVAQQSAAVAARNATKNGAKAPRWKSLLTKPATFDTEWLMGQTVSDLLDYKVTTNNAHDAAHIAQSLFKIAETFAEQASLWATDLPSDHGPSLSDDEIKNLTALCDDLFGKIIDLAAPFRDNRNDPSIEQALVECVGQPVLAKKQQDGTVRYQLDLERIRSSKSSEPNKKLSLTVNGVPMAGDNFAQEVDTAFSLKPLAFLDLLKDQLAGSGKYNTDGKPMPFSHNSKTYTVQLTAR